MERQAAKRSDSFQKWKILSTSGCGNPRAKAETRQMLCRHRLGHKKAFCHQNQQWAGKAHWQQKAFQAMAVLDRCHIQRTGITGKDWQKVIKSEERRVGERV